MNALRKLSYKFSHIPNKYLNWLDAIGLVVLFAFVVSGIGLVPFHGDESTYIWLSQDYYLLMNQQDRSAFLWDPNSTVETAEQEFHFSTGSILGFSIGFARDITEVGNKVNKRWKWEDSWNENIVKGAMPNLRLLLVARSTAASMGALSLVFFFLSARQLFGSRFPGWVATILLATQGGVLVSFRRAMQEGPKFLFLLISLYVAVILVKTLSKGGAQRQYYVWLGLASGITLAAKQDIAAVLAAIYFALALIPIWKKDKVRNISANILYLTAATLLAFASFLACMPVFWGWWNTVFMLSGFAVLLFQIPVWNHSRWNKFMALAGCMLIVGTTILSPSSWQRMYIPIERIADIRERAMNSQLNSGLPPLYGFNRKMNFFLRNTLTTDVMYKEVSNFGGVQLDEQISKYEGSPIHGRIGSPILDTLVAILFLFGCWSLLRNFSVGSIFVFSLFLIPALFLLIFVPLPWQRYFLIMQIAYSLIAGAGAEYVWRLQKELRRHIS